MKRALIHPELCLNCQPCLIEARCTMHAILRETQDDKPWVDFYRCSGCLQCKSFCPHHAVEEILHPCDGKNRRGW